MRSVSAPPAPLGTPASERDPGVPIPPAGATWGPTGARSPHPDHLGAVAGEPSSGLLGALPSEAPFGVAHIDTDLRYVRVNDRMASMNGSPAADHVGRTPAEVIPGMPADGLALLRHVLDTGEAVRGVEIEVPPGPGEDAPRTFVGDTVPVRDAGQEIVGLAVMATEVTETRRLERERERLLDELFSLAHTDALTGLPNRRAWNDALAEAVASSGAVVGPRGWHCST